MKKNTLITACALALLNLTNPLQAQQPAPAFESHPMMPMLYGENMPSPMYRPQFGRPDMSPRMMPDFPSPEELERMAPPQPLTEEIIKQRFAKRKAALEENLDRDRKAAEKYAQDFARYQKYQADRLAEIMAEAEKRREAMLQRLEQHEQQMLEDFRSQQQQPDATTPAPAVKDAT
jgi:hypothetical protein